MIPYVLAVFACCLAGALGGFALARPHEALALRGLSTIDAAPGGLAAARGFGAMMLLGHAGTAGLLGYYPGVGAAMALALGLLLCPALGLLLAVQLVAFRLLEAIK